MADTTTTPNMNLIIPTVGVDPGPGWANNINASLTSVDRHNHSVGYGVQINPSGIDVSSDLPFNGNNATTVRTVNFLSQLAVLSGAADIGCIYVVGNELYYNDELGDQVQITNGGSVNAGAGSIAGLPSGSASASFSGGTFSWRSATNTPAVMNMGPIVTGAQIASPKTVEISASSSQSANYVLTLPLALPGATSIMNVDASGNMGIVAPDNATFGLNSGVYKVLDGGVGTSQLADESVTQVKLATLPAGISQITSVSIGTTTYSQVTGLAPEVDALGTRPVLVIFGASQTDAGVGTITSTVANALSMAIKRNGTIIQEIKMSVDAGFFIPWTVVDLTPSAGVNEYTLFAKVGNGSGQNVTFNFCSLFAYEL